MLISSSVLETFSPGGIIFWCHIFLPFHIVHGILEARTLEWFAIPSTSEPGFIRTFYYDSSIWVALHGMTHSFIELCKPLHHAVILKGDMVFCCCSAAKSCPILCNSMDYSTPGFLVLHYSFRSMTIESVMLSNHLFLCHLLLLCLQSFPASVFFSNESALGTRWPMDCSFSISLPNEYSGLISFSIDWFDLFAVQGTLKSLLQQRSLVCHIKFL